ncbi:MAG: zinc ABC transporter substrate-binding protein [Sphaerochaeta sp.]|jgi:zinc transport system substrate-binding protein|nr:zinc ABC transporter substrate-binding protein [Sphaerochaeta sp.]
MRSTLILLVLLLPALLFGGGSKEAVDQKPVVAVSILPQAFFVDSIAAEYVEVVTLVAEGQNPHSYEPSPSQMAQLAKARIWLLSGTDFELALRPKVATLYPSLAIIDATEGMVLRTLEEDDDHHHDPDGLNIDRHSWLGHDQAKVLLTNTTTALLSLVGMSEGATIRARSDELAQRIDATFAALQAELLPLAGTTVFVYHPSFGYFLDSFGIVQEAVETGGKEPTAKDLERLITAAKAEGAKAIFVQKQFPAVSAQRVAQAVGAKVVALDPLAYDWLANILAMGQALKEAL